MKALVAVLIAVVLGAACGSGDSGSEPNLGFSEAFCNDLKTGMSPNQILIPTYTPEEAADRAYGFAAISCPAELRTNIQLRTFLEAWNINPDA